MKKKRYCIEVVCPPPRKGKKYCDFHMRDNDPPPKESKSPGEGS